MPTYSYFEIPTIASPQKFSIQLAGVTYNMVLTYHTADAGLTTAPSGAASDTDTDIDTNDLSSWILDIYDTTNVPIVNGIPLVTGIDLLYQYQYLAIGGSLVVATDGNVSDIPTFDNLGSTGHLYFVTVS